jgi:hypothetical protein
MEKAFIEKEILKKKGCSIDRETNNWITIIINISVKVNIRIGKNFAKEINIRGRNN